MDKFKYIFSLLLAVLSVSFSFGQDEHLYAEKKIKEPLQLRGIKFGANVGRFSDFQFKPERFSYEGSFDFNLNDKYFGVIEAGYSEINLEKSTYNYLSEGYFFKAGLEYNMLKKFPTDFFGVGIKLGMANFSQEANNISITTDHWGDFQTNIESKNYNAYWLEASLGIKGEVFKNVYLGWSALVRIRMSGGKNNTLQPYDIPGFGNGEKSLNLGATYYIYYQIPFNRNK